MNSRTLFPSTESKIDQLLRNNQLSITGSRKKILELFLTNNGALAHADIEKKAGEKIDRVTVYRTLQSFLEKGIIHTIPTPDNSVRYALCKEACGKGHHHDNHVHFVCTLCGNTTCLDDVLIPEVKLPTGFKPSEAQMVVSGMCGSCR
ncbi:MAG TPA: Fur family transcriptional regulator [Flavitalea sp.]|nr:Fur family transcriptional regulator [Flavitalea sp.]